MTNIITMATFKDTEIILFFTSLVLTLTTVASKGTAPHEIDCKDAPNGLHEIGCWGYANCVDGKPDIHDCGAQLVFDRATMTCVQPGSTQTDCFLPVDCNGKADGSYPDYTDSCVTYYRCINQKNLGRFYCPAQTAFNENLQICDYPQNLPPPCGSKIVTGWVTKPTATTTRKTTVMSTQTMMTSTMPTVTTTQKMHQTSQLHVILTSGSPKPSAQTSSTQMPTVTTTPLVTPALPVIG